MGSLLCISLLLALAANLASANTACIEAISWGDPRVDLFGWAPDESIWHRFYTGYDWQPELFERIPPSTSTSCPSVFSWGYGRLDIVYVNRSNEIVLHKYFDDGNWGPSWEDAIDLGGGGDIDLVDLYSWGKGRLDIVANAFNGSILHKAWTGTEYFPAGQVWEDLGGNFTGVPPSIVSWGEDRLDVVAISAETGSLLHKYWEGTRWSDWESLGGSFIGKPAITSWGPDRIDLWALDKDAGLNHKFWDGFQWHGWEYLGGKFSQTPRVVHWSQGKIDMVGKDLDDNNYYLKSFDGHNWHPSIDGWYDLAGPYGSEPRLVTKVNGQNFLYLFGVDVDNEIRMQIWSGYEWQPSAKETWPLGDVSKPYPTEEGGFVSKVQKVLLGTEL
ncbi:hypothetical protein GQX73_g9619 [Xylaria multiplex]|uniref:PLL-like beta propeller domain-containing protein n=1 Tax=Xylaria multiplex TaxID=323545 RepID=A0A7C8IQI1_9PEZI|nr:hypothetical protein GQX73_g9619 [Xylaria multiplex]